MDLKSGYPFWAVKKGLMCAFPQLDADLRCDVAMIIDISENLAPWTLFPSFSPCAQAWCRTEKTGEPSDPRYLQMGNQSHGTRHLRRIKNITYVNKCVY